MLNNQPNTLTNTTIDPVTVQVIGGALKTIAREMAHVMYRMAYSSLIRESEDLGAGIFDVEGNTLAEADSTPMQLGCLPGYIRGFQAVLGDNQHPEDIIWNNDPYAGASHSPDVALCQPIFYKGELVGYSGATAHHLDMGGAQPGLMVDVPDVYAEGLILNGVKLYDKGVRNETLFEVIRQNVRTPFQVIGDLEAQVAACRLGTRRYIELMDKYGKETVLLANQELMNYTERIMRKEIAKIPDGVYEAESWLDDDGRHLDKRLPVHVQVTIKGDELEVDVSKSSDQVSTAFNSAYSGALCVSTHSVLRSIFMDTDVIDDVPVNEGAFRPITIKARKGCIFNPIKPAATFSRANQVNTVADLIIKALAPVAPKQTCAGSSANIQFASYAGLDENNEYWVYIEVNEGSYGGRPEKDGLDAVDFSSWNTMNNPIEDLDMHIPMVCEQYELREDTGGAGRYRGGLGIVRWNRFITDGFMTMEGDKHTVRPWGYKGGLPGTPASLIKNPDLDNPEYLSSKLNGYRFGAGESVKILVPSSGGYGDPLERPEEQVLEDVLDQIISAETAYRDYGVVIKDKKVDSTATKQRREEIRNTRGEIPLYSN